MCIRDSVDAGEQCLALVHGVGLLCAVGGLAQIQSGCVQTCLLYTSSQHQTSTALSGTCGGNRVTPSPSPLLGALSHIHSKTACRGFKSFCPANPLVPRLCENRMAWGFFVPMLPWTGSSFSLPMPYMFPSCAISSHRLSKIQHQNRTPSFRFLRVSTTCGPLALSHAVRLSKNFPFLCLLHRNF